MKYRPLLWTLVSAIVPAGVSAQNVSENRASLTDQNQETIELSPFQVTADGTQGYVASESLSGTRIRATIKELPFNVNVVTSEFFEDFDKFDLSDALAFTSSASPNDIGPGSTNYRGFGASTLRNGVSFFGLLTRSNIDRVEVIKGAYAAIYGKTQPGGLINYISKVPSAKEQTSVSLTAGTLDYYRAMLSHTAPVTSDKRVLYRIDLGHNEKGGSQRFAKSWRDEYSGAVSFQFTENTKALLELSKLDNYASRPSPVVYLRDPVTNQYIGKMTENFYFNRSGPSGKDRVHQDWMTDNVYGYLDHRFNHVVSARLSGVWWERQSPALAMGGNQFLYTNTRTITGLNPNISDIMRDNLMLQADILAQYNTGRVGHKTLVSLIRSRETEDTWTRAMSAADLANPAIINRNLNVDNPSWFYPSFSDKAHYSVFSRDRAQITTTEAVFVSHRIDLLESKLKGFVGGRYDRVGGDLRDRLTNLRQETTATAFTPQAGFNYTPIKPVSFYASYSESYQPQSQTRTNTQELYPNEQGIGYEVGIKTSFFQNRLNFTLGAYKIERNNVLQTYSDPVSGMDVTNIDGQIKTDGLELDFNWQVTPELQILGGAGLMDNRVTRNDESPWVVGKLVARGPAPYNYGVALVYRFKEGLWNGLSFRADVSGQGASLGEYGTGPYTRAGVTYADDGRIRIKQPGYTIFNAGMGYSFRTPKTRFGHSFSLNFKNITDVEYSIGNWIPADGFSTSFSYTLKF